MTIVQLLENAIAAAWRHGYQVRHEYLDGSGGGFCEYNGKKWIFVDLAQNHLEQLDQVREVLVNDKSFDQTLLDPVLRIRESVEANSTNQAA